MNGYRVVTMDETTADGVRRTLMAPDYPHPAHAEVAADPAPCRVCLRRFAPGEERRLLFTYDPFRDTVDLPLSRADLHPRGRLRALRGRRRLPAQPARRAADGCVDYVHVRCTRAGCFLCRLDRAAA